MHTAHEPSVRCLERQGLRSKGWHWYPQSAGWQARSRLEGLLIAAPVLHTLCHGAAHSVTVLQRSLLHTLCHSAAALSVTYTLRQISSQHLLPASSVVIRSGSAAPWYLLPSPARAAARVFGNRGTPASAAIARTSPPVSNEST